MEYVTELYDDGEIRLIEKRIKRTRIIMLLTAAAVLSVCILLCRLVNTSNSDRMELSVIAISIVSGWVLLYIRRFVLIEDRHELCHAMMLRESERETILGSVTVSAEKMKIKNSIPFRTVTIETDGKIRRTKIIDSKAKELEAAGKELELFTANGYVAAFRVP